MNKCREAFEQIPEIKDSLSENIVFVGNKYTTADEGFYDLVNWLNGGWYTWQSRQAEVDHLERIISLRDAQLTEEIAISIKWISRSEEKDKRINQALNFINNWWHPDLDQKLFVEALGRALRGEQ